MSKKKKPAIEAEAPPAENNETPAATPVAFSLKVGGIFGNPTGPMPITVYANTAAEARQRVLDDFAMQLTGG